MPPLDSSAVKYGNAQELVVMRRAEPPAEKRDAEQPIEYAVARVLITSEQRGSYDDALQRLRAIAAAWDEPAQFVEISGWPAVEVKFAEPLPRRGAKGEEEETEPFSPTVQVQRAITAIAADDKVVTLDASVLPDAPQGLLQGAQDLALSARFAKQGNPGEVQETLRRLQAEENERQSLRRMRRGLAPLEGPTLAAGAAMNISALPSRCKAEEASSRSRQARARIT